MSKNLCEICDRPITTTDHLDHDAYPTGHVVCASCFKDSLIADLTGLRVMVTATLPPESFDIATARRTQLTEAGAQVTTDWNGGVVWVVDQEPPDELKPFITAGWPRDAREEGGEDD